MSKRKPRDEVDLTIREIDNLISKRDNGGVRKVDGGDRTYYYLAAIGRYLVRKTFGAGAIKDDEGATYGRRAINTSVLVSRRRRGRGGNAVFRVKISAAAKSTAAEIGHEIYKSVIDQAGEDYDDAYESGDEYEILSFAHHTTYFDHASRGDYRAHHTFQPNQMEQSFAMRSLYMKDFSCIYESLMIIMHHKLLPGVEFPFIFFQWVGFVLSNFINESEKFQADVLDGKIYDCLIHFHEKYGIVVDIYDANYVTEEEEHRKLIKQQEVQPEYYLVYWSEHVFPVRAGSVRKVSEYIYNKIETLCNKKSNFYIIPQFFYDLYHEYCLYYLTPEDERNDNMLMIANSLKGTSFDKRFFYACLDLGLKNCGDVEAQMKIYLAIAEMVDKNYSDEDVDELIERYVIAQNHYKENKLEKLLTYYRKLVLRERELNAYFFDKTVVEYVEAKKVARRKHFKSKYGLACVDIETCNDLTMQHSRYVMRPFMVSIYGRLQKIMSKQNTQGYSFTLSSAMIDVDETFIGYNCIEQMFDWMNENGFFWSDYDLQQLEYRSVGKSAGRDGAPMIVNYIFAHNGFSFDFKYMYEELQKRTRGFQLIGDMQQTREVKGGGLIMLDFFKLMKGSLKDLAKKFFPDDPSKHKLEDTDVANLSPADVDRMLEERGEDYMKMVRYNRQDCVALYHIVFKFFSDLFSTVHGHGFMKKPFYHSLPAAAWAMWEKCFLKVPIFTVRDQQAIDMEKASVAGGLNIVFRQKCGIGYVVDWNQCYPTICKNLMPCYYRNPRYPVEYFREPLVVSYENKHEVNTYDLYSIKYSFPRGQKYPTITSRCMYTLVQLLQSQSYDDDSNTLDVTTVWGTELLVALECCPRTVIKIFKRIQYIPVRVDDDYIEYHYQQRLKCKKANDTLGADMHKLYGNGKFGKHLQKSFKEVVVGDYQTVRDEHSWIMQRTDVDYDSIELTQVVSDYVPIYELKYTIRGKEYGEKGATRRFGSFITGSARACLMHSMHVLVKIFGDECIAYCDTDSIMLALDYFDKELNRKLQKYMMSYVLARKEHDETNQLVASQMIETLMPAMNELKRMLEAVEVQKYTELHDRYARYIMLDEYLLGSFKLEKVLLTGSFTGQKQYRMFYWENGKICLAYKMKGVRKIPDDNVFDALEQPTVDPDTGVVNLQVMHIVQEVWKAIGTGVTIVQQFKALKPTLYKRIYNEEDCTSRPFINDAAFIKNRKEYNEKMEAQKQLYYMQFEGLVNQIRNLDENYAVSSVYKLKHLQNKEVAQIADAERNLMMNFRKAFLVKLPKIKFDSVQDKVIKVALADHALMQDMIMLLSKCVYTAYTSICMVKKDTKHTVQMNVVENHMYGLVLRNKYNAKGEDEVYYVPDRMCHYTLDLHQSARVIAFTLFSYYIAESRGLHITEQFKFMCEQVALICSESTTGEKMPGDCNWRRSIIVALKFLTSPITIQRDNVPTKDDSIVVTSLWRFFNNVLAVIPNLDQMISHENGEDVEMIDAAAVQQQMTQEQLMFGYREIPIVSPVDFQPTTFRDQSVGDKLLERYFQSYKNLSQKERVREDISDEKLEQVFIETTVDTHKRGKVLSEALYGRDAPFQAIDEEGNHASDYVFKSLILNQNYIKIDYEQQSIKMYRVMELVTKQMQTTIVEQQRSYCSIFNLGGQKNQKLIKLDDVMDIIFFVQYMYFGNVQAVEAIRRVQEQYFKFVYNRRSTTQFIEVCSLIFQKPHFFGEFARTNTSRKYVKDFQEFIDAFVAVVDNTYVDHCIDREEYVKLLVIEAINKSATLKKKDLHAAIQTALYSEVKDEVLGLSAVDIGRALTYKINQWYFPTYELTDKLRVIMLSKRVGAQAAAEYVLRMRYVREVTQYMIQQVQMPQFEYPLYMDLQQDLFRNIDNYKLYFLFTREVEMQELDRHYKNENHFDVLDHEEFYNNRRYEESDDECYDVAAERFKTRELMRMVDGIDEEIKQEYQGRDHQFLRGIIPMSGYDSGEEIHRYQLKYDRFLKRTKKMFDMECDEGEESDESVEGMFKYSKRRRFV